MRPAVRGLKLTRWLEEVSVAKNLRNSVEQKRLKYYTMKISSVEIKDIVIFTLSKHLIDWKSLNIDGFSDGSVVIC